MPNLAIVGDPAATHIQIDLESKPFDQLLNLWCLFTELLSIQYKHSRLKGRQTWPFPVNMRVHVTSLT
jgi:hypothetical protein